MAFMVLRRGGFTVQAALFQSETISKEFVAYASK